MGGLIIVVLWPLLLPLMILYFFQVAMPLIAPILMIWNLILLGMLLLIRWVWKRSGTMDRGYIGQKSGFVRVLLLILRYGLLLFIVWEAVLAILCGTYFLWWPEVLKTLL